jgi:CheY-like chemotaxis protein
MTPITVMASSELPIGALPGDAVLLVEDDEALREALLTVLADDGVTAVAAANGREALDLLQQGWRPRVLLVDLLMPVMNGPDLESALRADARLSSLPIIYMTASMLRPPGAAPLFHKPLQMDSLLRALRVFLRPA